MEEENKEDVINRNSGIENGNKSLFECYICLDVPKNPVATTCGHIFCWTCLQAWLNGKAELQCPVCKNGIDMDRIVSLYTTCDTSTSSKDDRPKPERLKPVINQNRPSYFSSLINGLGFRGVNNSPIEHVLPTQNEVKVNRLALIFLVFGLILFFSLMMDIDN